MFFSALILFPFRKRIVKKFHKAIQHSKGQEDKLEKEYCLLMYLVDEFHKGRLSLKEQRDLLLPLVGKFYEIGAYSRFNQIIMELKHLDSELDYKLWRFHNCINKYDFTGMKEWLRRTEENQQKVSDKQRIQILNNLIAINCSTEITKETSSIIAELEENIFYKNIFIHEALENLMLEYENKIDIYRIDKLIIFINEFTYSSWQDYLNSFNVLYRHYQREKNIKKLQELVEIISKKSQVFKQTEEEKLIFEISLVRLLIDSQMGRGRFLGGGVV